MIILPPFLFLLINSVGNDFTGNLPINSEDEDDVFIDAIEHIYVLKRFDTFKCLSLLLLVWVGAEWIA